MVCQLFAVNHYFHMASNFFQLVASREAGRKAVSHGTGITAHVSEKLPLQYARNSIPFNTSDEARRTFMPPSDSFHPLTPDKMADFVFVTAASSNHFDEAVDAIASIQTLMPRKRIYFFDIGLKADQIAKVI